MNLTKNIKIRILAFMMAFWLAFSVSYNDYQEVEALEWAIPVIGFDTAIKFLLGLLGVSLTSKALHDNIDWSEVRQNCVDYQIQQGNDAVAVGEWWEDVIHGTLNQASDCWTSFKEWAQTMVSSGSVSASALSDFLSTGTVSYSNGYSITYSSDNMTALRDKLSNMSDSLPDWYDVNSFNGIYYTYRTSGRNLTSFIFLQPSVTYSIDYSSRVITGNLNFQYVSISIDDGVSSFVHSVYIQSSPVSSYSFNLSNIQGIFSTFDASAESIFDSANDKIEDTALTNENATTDAIPGALPLPWDNVSDTAEGVADAIDALQEAVAEGVLSLEDFWERVQELVGALAIDTTTDEVLPNEENPDTGENETLQDRVQENTSNGTFTLGGMEKVFPFCIPWDIYAFVTLLVATPAAPKINYPFYNPVTKQNINIEIDFADWETVVVLFRYILDFLLIIGLLLLARSLAGAGGDD